MNETGGLGYEDDLVIAWEKHAAAGEEALHRINVDAVRALKALAAMEDLPREALDDSSVIHHELHRIEGKIDLLLSLVGVIASGQEGESVSCSVFVRADGVQWREQPAALEFADGEAGIAAIYLYPRLAVPVRLPALAVVTPGGFPEIRFTDLTTETRNVLERHVFRHHRRAVARARDARAGDS